MNRTVRIWLVTNLVETVDLPKFFKLLENQRSVFFHTVKGGNDANENVMETFHRIVMADGVVASSSAFSFAPIMLNNSTLRMVAPGWVEDRKAWLQSSRFIRFSKEGSLVTT